jgi:hypothetical protein
MKMLNFDGLCESLQQQPLPKDGRELESALIEKSQMVCNVFAGGKPLAGTTSFEVVGGAMRVDDAPTGFMMIERQVLVRLRELYPQDNYDTDTAGYDTEEAKRGGPFHDWFKVGVFQESDGRRRLLSEDYYFCRTCTRNGIEVWADILTPLIHTGQYHYQGCMGLRLMGGDRQKLADITGIQDPYRSLLSPHTSVVAKAQ